jgi:hypothetical protein
LGQECPWERSARAKFFLTFLLFFGSGTGFRVGGQNLEKGGSGSRLGGVRFGVRGVRFGSRWSDYRKLKKVRLSGTWPQFGGVRFARFIDFPSSGMSELGSECHFREVRIVTFLGNN